MANPLYMVHNDAYDDGLNYVATNADRLTLCEGQPATYAEATDAKGAGGKRLGAKAVTFTGPADGDVSGRKLTTDAVLDITVDVTGVWDFVAIVNDAGGSEQLLLVTPVPFKAIESADDTADEVVVDGDISGDIAVDDDVTIRQSTANDGEYTVSSVNYDGGTGKTTVGLTEGFTDGTNDGYLLYGAVKLTSGGTTNTAAFDRTLLDANSD